MAIEFARCRYVKRSDGGNACRSAAYNARSDIRCERTGERFFFAHRSPGLHHEVLLPEGADAGFLDPAVLWNRAQAAEKRRDGQEAREVLLALPSNPGLGLDDWLTMCREFVHEHFVSKGVAVQLNIHEPHEGEVNVHAHLLITTRRIEGKEFSAKKARDLDPEVRTFKGKHKLVTEAERWGALWRDYQNLYFERQGLDIRVDETGFAPQRHEGPVRLRTVPEKAKARLDETRAANEAAARDPVQVLHKLTERRATFTELDIERLLRKHIALPAERREIRAAVLARPEVVGLYDRQTAAFANRFTTREVRAEEKEVIATAVKVGRRRRPIDRGQAQEVARQHRLDRQQKEAFDKATGTDGIVVIEGLAGTGKSHTINAIREAYERQDWRVVGVSLMNTVADDLRRSGFAQANTAHREIWWQERGGNYAKGIPRWDERTLVIVDEAAMLDTHIYARLMRQAADKEVKIVLAGDDRQLGSVERGGLFTQLKERHGSVVISKVRRQEQDWQRAASEAFADGRMEEGLKAYSEHGHIHWSQQIDESRDRLLSDWDQDSRQRPEMQRFVYASTNGEVNILNRAIHDIRVRRGEVKNELEVETVRGKFAIGPGERLQFHGNDRERGIYNGSVGTVTAIAGSRISLRTDTGRDVQFDTASFKEFGLGYAGTVYRGQGKTQTEVYALYDNVWAWNARTAYVGLTRHKNRVELYVSRDLAPGERILAEQMTRRVRDEASLAWATRAEIQRERDGRERGGRSGGAGQAGPPQARSMQLYPPEEIEMLRKQVDIAAYARDVHGYKVLRDPEGGRGHFTLTSHNADGSVKDKVTTYRRPNGQWVWRDWHTGEERGDIFDFAQRAGAADLEAALASVSVYDAAMREPGRRQRAAEEKGLPAPAVGDPEEQRLARLGAAAERDREIAGADYEDRLEAAAEAEEQRQAFFRDEAERTTRLSREAAEAKDAEQARLRQVEQAPAAQREAWLDARKEEVAEARLGPAVGMPGAGRPGPAAGGLAVGGPVPERAEPQEPKRAPERTLDAVPARARYLEALAQHYDPRDPYGSLAKASLAEAASFARDQQALNRQIAAESDPAKREALTLQRDIEHAEHLEQAYGRLAGMARATGADPRPDQERAAHYREQAAGARRTWQERSREHPDIAAGQTSVERDSPQPDLSPQDRPPQAPRTLAQEREAMRRLNLPEYAESKHGFGIEWKNDDRTRAVLTKGTHEIRATRAQDGTWSYASQYHEERGDILDFEAHRGAKNIKTAREQVRPELERAERDIGGRLDRQPEVQRQGPERGGPSRDDDRGYERELDPRRRR